MRNWKSAVAAIAVVLLFEVIGYLLKYLLWTGVLKGVIG